VTEPALHSCASGCLTAAWPPQGWPEAGKLWE